MTEENPKAALETIRSLRPEIDAFPLTNPFKLIKRILILI